MNPDLAASRARELDAQDPLARFRDEFVIDDPELIYLDGNSLGRLPKRTATLMRELVERQWGSRLVQGWGEHWIGLPERLGSKIAQLVGAEADEVIVCDSTSVDFFKLASACLEARPGRSRIVTDDANFPSDVYLLQGCARQTGHRIDIVEPGRVAEALDDQTALLTLSHTAFKSGYVHPMRELTARAHEVGALVLWDLSHSVGALPIALSECNADAAVGCTYKYLNGGPGAPAFLFVRRDLQEVLKNPIWGWFGQHNAFDFSLEYEPADGIRRFLAGTPPILSMAAIEPGVDMVLEAGIENLREKSVGQTDFLIELWGEFLEPLGMTLNSPLESAQRGSHVSFGHEEGYRIDQALIKEMKVVPDFRHPDNIRFGVTPLSTTYTELAEAMFRTRRVIEERLFEKYSKQRETVT